MEPTFRSPFSYGISNSGKRLPRNGLLIYLARPNSDEYLVGEDTEVGEDTYIWGYVLPDDSDIRAATGWESGTANVFYTADGTPIVALATEINRAILPANVVWHLTDETQQTGRLAIYAAATAWATIEKARSVLRDDSIDHLFFGTTGLWYDPQDLTTMYQDAAGTLPVYRPGSGAVDPPVGLLLDKGQGLELGPEPTNGLPADFNDLSTWTARGTATVGADGLVSGLLSITGAGDIFRYANAAFPAKTYLNTRARIKRVSTVGIISLQHPSGGSTWGAGRFVVNLSKLSDDWEWIDEFHPAVSNIIQWSSNSAGTGGVLLKAQNLAGQESLSVYVDSFFQSVRREIKGYHAYQATTTARPTLSGRYNILTATETLATQSVTTVATNYTLSFSGTGTITLSGTATGTYSAGSHTITCTAGTLTCTVAGTVTRADLRVKRDGSSLPAYQRVVDANTYDTAGFPLYLKRDKVDDDLICQVPAGGITGAWAHGTIDGPIIGTVVIPAGEYHPFGVVAIFGLPNCTQWIAINGPLSASEQAVFERYVYSKARQLTTVPQFGGVSTLENAFHSRNEIKTIDATMWDLSSNRSIKNTFNSCGNLVEVSGNSLVSSKTTTTRGCFNSANKLQGIDISGWETSALVEAYYTFGGCRNLETVIVGNAFDNTPCTDFADAFFNTNLNQSSIDAILVSINNAGTSNGTFKQSGGSAPSVTGQAAITAMRSRGWAVTVTGGF